MMPKSGVIQQIALYCYAAVYKPALEGHVQSFVRDLSSNYFQCM